MPARTDARTQLGQNDFVIIPFFLFQVPRCCLWLHPVTDLCMWNTTYGPLWNICIQALNTRKLQYNESKGASYLPLHFQSDGRRSRACALLSFLWWHNRLRVLLTPHSPTRIRDGMSAHHKFYAPLASIMSGYHNTTLYHSPELSASLPYTDRILMSLVLVNLDLLDRKKSVESTHFQSYLGQLISGNFA